MNKRLGLLLVLLLTFVSAVVIAGVEEVNYDNTRPVFRNGFRAAPIGQTGTVVANIWSATLTTNFIGVAANTCKDSTTASTVTGTPNVGDVCSAGSTTNGTSVVVRCFASSTSAVKFKVCNVTASNITNLTSTKYNAVGQR